MRTVEDECVILTVSTYNKLLRDSTRANFVVDKLFEIGEVNLTSKELVYTSDDIAAVLRLVYPERYKSKLSALPSIACN